MTPEEKRAYNKQYRAEGYGANADARYRLKNRERIREYMREYYRRLNAVKRDDPQGQNTSSS